jgi:hypothetical protein
MNTGYWSRGLAMVALVLDSAGPTTANWCNKSVVHTTAQYKGKSMYIKLYIGVIYGPPRPPDI